MRRNEDAIMLCMCVLFRWENAENRISSGIGGALHPYDIFDREYYSFCERFLREFIPYIGSVSTAYSRKQLLPIFAKASNGRADSRRLYKEFTFRHVLPHYDMPIRIIHTLQFDRAIHLLPSIDESLRISFT